MTRPALESPTEATPRQPAELATLKSPSFYTALRRENQELAYLLGAWAALTGVGGQPDRRISFASQDPRQLALIQERITSVLGTTTSPHAFSIHGIPYYRISISGEEVAQHFQRVTDFNSRVPWEHLETERECHSYLRGVFDHGGWVFTGTCAGIGINKIEGEHLLHDLSRVFSKLGILPIITYGQTPSLKLKDGAEWRSFASKVGFSLPERQSEVDSLCARPSHKHRFGIEDYAAVQTQAKSGGYSFSEISRLTGVPTNSVRDWLIRGQRPPVVKRAEIIAELSESMANPEVVNFVYRYLGASSAVARECGMRTTPAAARELASHYDDSLHTIYGNDQEISRFLLAEQTKEAHPL